jgi:hypothetical protein
LIAAFTSAGLDDGAFVTEAGGGESEVVSKVGERLTADIAQLDALEVVPDALIRVEVRGVSGELLQADASGAAVSQEVLDRLAAMDGGTVPDDQQLARDLAEQMLEEAHDIRARVRVILHEHEQTTRRRDAADDGQMVVGQGQTEDGSLPPGGVGADSAGEQVEARFVDPDDGSPLLVSPFFRAGQRSVCQASIAASFRWLARSIGFWTLQPSARRSLPT